MSGFLVLDTKPFHYSLGFIAYFVSSIGFSTGFLGTFRTSIDGPRFPLAWFLLITSLILNIILIITLSAERYVTSRSQCIYKRVLLFPVVWTGLWFLVGRFGPLGDYPSLSTVLIIWSDFSQVASLGGRSLLDFIVAVSGTIIFEFSSFPMQALFISDSPSVLLANSEVHEEYTADEPNTSTSRKRQCISLLVHPITIYSIILTLVFTYGGLYVNVRPNSLYQVTYPEYIPKTVPVGCVVGPGDTYPELQADHDVWFKKSAELVGDGAKLVIWSEITTVVENLEEEEIFIQRARDFALLHKVYLGVTYSLSGPVKKNKFVLVTKSGDIGIDYNKAHPVPGVVKSAGPNTLQYIDTEEFGRVGGAICFDFNFADFIGQASTHKVDVMLQPSWTWGPIGTYHQQGNILRPVENGFTLFRCVSQGVSGIFEPTLNGVFNQKVASNNVEKYVFYLPIQKRLVTLYAYIGDLFGYICLIASVVLLISTYRDSRRLHQLSI
ncbi:hypothetical protein INT48_009374 [Thamnidium elegans]|uniref:CN hydrolase domain-containing protein n=1 Tax=Thamnidium elegans TaxID=101142 RepID=A0A8H7VW47_9FUNG|nr:hypothetical protein INT48_009374 [Thamnidium elegans]